MEEDLTAICSTASSADYFIVDDIDNEQTNLVLEGLLVGLWAENARCGDLLRTLGRQLTPLTAKCGRVDHCRVEWLCYLHRGCNLWLSSRDGTRSKDVTEEIGGLLHWSSCLLLNRGR